MFLRQQGAKMGHRPIFSCWRADKGGHRPIFSCWRADKGGHRPIFSCWRVTREGHRPPVAPAEDPRGSPTPLMRCAIA